MSNEVYLDLGEESLLRMSNAAMAKVFKALIQHKGKLHDSHIDDDVCVLRISMDATQVESFAECVSPIVVSQAPQVGVSQEEPSDLLKCLSALPSSIFDEVVFKLDLGAFVPSGKAPQIERATTLLKAVRTQGQGLSGKLYGVLTEMKVWR